jgi:hypothetical protein
MQQSNFLDDFPNAEIYSEHTDQKVHLIERPQSSNFRRLAGIVFANLPSKENFPGEVSPNGRLFV